MIRNNLFKWTTLSLLVLAVVVPFPGLLYGAEDAVSQPKAADVWKGVACLAAALAVGIACLASSFAVARIGSAGMGALTEKPELMGKALVFLGLAEGIAIYGLIIAIMIMNKI